MPNPDEYALEVAKAAAEAAGKESVNKLSIGIGGLFPFWGLKKKAVDAYINEITTSTLSPEAKMMAIANARKTYKERYNQLSIAQIVQKAAKPGTDFSEKSSVDDEWLERFMNSARFVSNEKVQLLWGNILAKEFENPNSTPPSIIRILSEITPRYAKIFETICNLAVEMVLTDNSEAIVETNHQIIMSNDHEYLYKHEISFSTLNELQLLGLLQYEPMGILISYENNEIPKFHITYDKKTATVIGYPDKAFPIGTVRLTDAGEVIAGFVDKQIIPSHFDAVIKYLEAHGVKFADTPEVSLQN